MDKQKIWSDFLKPVVILTVICIVTSALLALTNEVTAPIILQSEIDSANAQRAELLPADGFTEIESTIEGVTQIYKADGDMGYVITAGANGYNGNVPVMVAFDTKGKILGVSYLPNSETPGFGQKVREDDFQLQFSGMDAQPLTLSDIDAVSGATVSSSAAVTALNKAIEAYGQVSGNETQESVQDLTPENIHELVLPNAGELTQVDMDNNEVDSVLKGENYGHIVYASELGYNDKPLTAVVGFDDDGVIVGVWFDSTGETDGLGTQVTTNPDFAQGFIGDSGSADTDIIASATYSSQAAIDAVNKAVNYINNVTGGA